MITYNKVVIGSSLRALLYSYNNNLPIFFTKPDRPFRFEYFDPAIDLSFIGICPEIKEILTFGEPKLVGIPKSILWETLMFSLSIDGLCPLSNLCHSLRANDGIIVCSNEYSKIAQFSFDECVFFGNDGVLGIAQEKEVINKNYICYDWIAINKGGKITQDYMEVGDSLVHHVWFYSSDRIDGNTGIKDACVVSYLSEEQLANFDYSPTMTRFKLVSEMEKRGLKGPHAGGYTTTGKPKRYKIRTSYMNRHKEKNYIPQWSLGKKVSMVDVSEEELLEEFRYVSQDNTTFLRFYNAFSGHHTGS